MFLLLYPILIKPENGFAKCFLIFHLAYSPYFYNVFFLQEIISTFRPLDPKSEIILSLIVPVYNRATEVEELLASLIDQVDKDFEMIIIEDGSSQRCETIAEKYKSILRIRYHYKSNSGPGLSRNEGCRIAKGNYFIFLDSDCVIPPEYIGEVKKNLTECYSDAFGGPDKAHHDFSRLQKAINYSMTSFLTTGGIRGGSEKMDKFYPRSFNMGYARYVFEATGGFSNLRFGEDIDMSLRIMKQGFSTCLYKTAWVYHKRRTSLKLFYKQVYNSGIARINLYRRYPVSLKLVHLLPLAFVFFVLASALLSAFISVYFILPLLGWIFLIFIDSTIRNGHLVIGLLSVITSFIQVGGYGLGFFKAVWKRIILGHDEFSAFKENFYT